MSAGDFDIGEQFHNYMLHISEQPYCGVDLPPDFVEQMRADGFVADCYMRWIRLVFGWQSSPYFALRMHVRGLELALGDPADSSNAFQWDHVKLNLPGSENYDPAFPRVRKVRVDGLTAVDMVSFFDDGRVFGPTQPLVTLGLRQLHLESRLVATRMQPGSGARSPYAQERGRDVLLIPTRAL
jgi:hypothetical protein